MVEQEPRLLDQRAQRRAAHSALPGRVDRLAGVGEAVGLRGDRPVQHLVVGELRAADDVALLGRVGRGGIGDLLIEHDQDQPGEAARVGRRVAQLLHRVVAQAAQLGVDLLPLVERRRPLDPARVGVQLVREVAARLRVRSGAGGGGAAGELIERLARRGDAFGLRVELAQQAVEVLGRLRGVRGGAGERPQAGRGGADLGGRVGAHGADLVGLERGAVLGVTALEHDLLAALL